MQSPYNGQIKSPILLAVIITIYRNNKENKSNDYIENIIKKTIPTTI